MSLEKSRDVVLLVHGKAKCETVSMFREILNRGKTISLGFNVYGRAKQQQPWSSTKLDSLTRADGDTVPKAQLSASQTLYPDLIAAPPNGPAPPLTVDFATIHQTG